MPAEWIEILKIAFLGLGGGFALYRYADEQQWKRQQFATTLFRTFAEKDTTRKAMTMLDWTRYVELHPDAPPDARFVKVDRDALIAALATDRTKFSRSEVRIRDIFDAFLSDLTEFEHHIATRLLASRQVEPYLSYWAKLVTGNGHRKDPELWAALDRYLECYDYAAVKSLFARFGHRFEATSPDGG